MTTRLVFGFIAAACQQWAAPPPVTVETSTEQWCAGDLTVNLRTESGAVRLLQISPCFEVAPGAARELDENQRAIQDAILMATSEFSAAELEAPGGQERLAAEIQRRVDAVLSEDESLQSIEVSPA